MVCFESGMFWKWDRNIWWTWDNRKRDWRKVHCLAPVIEAANFVVLMTGARQGWGSSHGLDEVVVQRDNRCGFFAVPVKIKWTNDRFGLIIWFLGEFACIWWRSMWWFVHLFFTQYGDLWGDLPELVIFKVMVWSPYLVKIHVTILSLFVSPHRVIFLGICQNWWQLRW